ncbi:hypothetical protein [Microbacterium sp.]|uniref:hypothetical protein n=1 Tax=Microbacterium sp. TaxID=51671 RepID=UPI0028A2DACC|nr:hypothetical protein [Microbacterium sp.]
MVEPQPEVRWAPLPPRPRNRGRLWLIVGLVVAALVIVGLLLFFLLPRDGAPAPGGSASPSPSATTSPSASPSTPNAPSEGATPDPTPLTTPPPVGDPSLEVFRDKVGGWLTAAERGLDIVDENRNQDALPVVDSLQEDAQRLGDAVPPSSIQDAWRSGVETYADRLTALRTALESDSGVSGALDSARSAVAELRSVAGF